ncbi:MAG TPA: hypothetical protein VLT51_02845 [Anaerolineales bacterium]|nr:hypothetical protein [Anaerolineales bacterium]
MEQTPELMALTACSGTLTDPGNHPGVDYDGKRVYFCNPACLRVFEENPDGFMNGEVDHPLGAG